MIQCYATPNDILAPAETSRDQVVWMDLLCPAPEEVQQVEAALGLEIPSHAEMSEIEISSRLYSAGDSDYMTVILPANADGGDPQMGPVSFILTPTHLVTVRYHEPRVFTGFPQRAQKTAQKMPDARTVLIALIEAVVDRQADILEHAARDIDAISRLIFNRPAEGGSRDYQAILEKIGQLGNLNSDIRDSLLTLERQIGYFGVVAVRQNFNADLHERVRSLATDANSLTDHAGFLASKITFLLDAALGMINIEQNATIKIFSVVAVIFLPPTLIASIYGMNFIHMPELHWLLGYPFALGLMVLFAVLPYLYFKFRDWL